MILNRPAWLTVPAADVPDSDGWLSSAERAVLAGLRVAARRRDWRLGRWVVKRAITGLLGADASRIEIVVAPDGAPDVLVDGLAAPVAVSISHRAGVAACLVTPAEVAPGCDLELIEPRPEVFARDFFTVGELALIQQWPADQRDLLVTLVWSAKESGLKALRQGLRLDTREVEVNMGTDDKRDLGWRPLRVSYRARLLGGWWRIDGHNVLTAVTEPATRAPLRLA